MVNKRSHGRTPEAVIVRDEDGTIRYWSREAELIYGWTPQEVLGARTHTLFGTKFPTSLTMIEKQMRKNVVARATIHRRRDGSLVTVNSRWHSSPSNPKAYYYNSHSSSLRVTIQPGRPSFWKEQLDLKLPGADMTYRTQLWIMTVIGALLMVVLLYWLVLFMATEIQASVHTVG